MVRSREGGCVKDLESRAWPNVTSRIQRRVKMPIGPFVVKKLDF